MPRVPEELRARTGAPILVGPGGAAPLSWDVTEIGGEASVGEGDGAVVAVPTPGHRPDHLAFLTPDGTLIAGDALTDRPAVILPPEGDRDLHRATLATIAGLVEAGTVRRIVPGHGPAILADPPRPSRPPRPPLPPRVRPRPRSLRTRSTRLQTRPRPPTRSLD